MVDPGTGCPWPASAGISVGTLACCAGAWALLRAQVRRRMSRHMLFDVENDRQVPGTATAVAAVLGKLRDVQRRAIKFIAETPVPSESSNPLQKNITSAS